MTVKEYLMQIKILSRRIKHRRDQIDYIAASLGGLKAIDYSKARVQTSPSDMMAEYAVRLDELTRETADMIVQLEKSRNDIIDKIGLINNDVYETLLINRYVKGLRFEEIAIDMGYTFRHVIRLHGEALMAMNNVLECHI